MYLIIFALLLIAVLLFSVNKLFVKYWNYNLKVEVKLETDEANEGDVINLRERITNKKFIPVPILEVDFNLSKNLKFVGMENAAISDKLYRRDVFALSPYQRITRTLELECLKRGIYDIKAVGISSNNLFLTKRMILSQKADENLVVYPQKISTDRLAPLYRTIMGEISSKRNLVEDPFEFDTIREYRPGDSMKSVNWKASAKTSELLVNRYNSTIKQNVLILLDYSENHNADDTDLNEECIRLTASLSERLMLEGVNTDIITNAVDFRDKSQITVMNSISAEQTKTSLSAIEEASSPEFKIGEDFSFDNYTVVVISKNINSESIKKLAERINGSFSFILPYKYEQKEIPALNNAKIILWKYAEGKSRL